MPIFARNNISYAFTRIIGLAIKPTTLWILIDHDQELADLFAQLLILGQLCLLITGTQIHKEFFHDLSDSKHIFRAQSFTEGLIISPFCIAFIFLIGIQHPTIVIYILVQVPLDKILEDRQRELSYFNQNTKMAVLALCRSSLLPIIFLGTLLFNNSIYSALLLTTAFSAAICFLFSIQLSYQEIFSRQSFKVVSKRLLERGLIGVGWSLSTGMSLQYDKILASYHDLSIADYLFRFQLVHIAFVAYSVLCFIPNRYLVLQQPKTFQKNINRLLPYFLVMVVILAIVSELLSKSFDYIPSIDIDVAIYQALIISLCIWSHSRVEQVFWKFPIKISFSYEFAGLCILYFVLFILTFADFDYDLILLNITLYLLIRAMILSKCTYSH